MGVSANLTGSTLTLVIDGDLDVQTGDHPVRELRGFVGRHHLEQVVVDVSGVGFVDSSGLGALIRVQQEARRYGARTRLVGVEPRLQRLLQLTGLDQEFLAHRPRPEIRDEAS